MSEHQEDSARRHFTFWSEVPAGYLTKAQLQDLDLPREPRGPVRATLDGCDGAGRRAARDLYLVSESVPTRSSAAQLAAAAARRTTGARQCEQCGARPELPCARVDGWLLCGTCAHIEKLRARQKQAAEQRTHAAELAARLLADERLAVVHVDYTDRGATPAGARRPPSAAHVTALDADGQVLCDISMRLVSPRSQGIPQDAVAPEEAAAHLRRTLARRVMLVWNTDGLVDLSTALRGLDLDWPFPSGYGNRHQLFQLALDWRSDLDPASGQPRDLVPPGRADRTLYLLRQIAAPTEHYLGQAPREHR
ncbi:hypothetical protein [Streptomyces sp. H27-D2]|uniref:hypothetical protein n=1 Tax=Streptomyces sp. H27-D2 TaxID=3046304 RepID=UPI002DBD2398|nr:hypothetical protein [Streptomyces sp. H27-D2]MEC4015460.1 hypothetical protein [Streptomyces sp. H27-D2]